MEGVREPQDGVVAWVHFGDQHLTERGEANFHDLSALANQARVHLRGGVEFAYLPGDIAEHGAAGEYALAREALEGLGIPLFAIPGDHDMHPRNLAAFRAAFPSTLPRAVEIAGCRCLFLDIVSAGRGGPDFRLGKSQIEWLEASLASEGRALVFMHAYPADLADEGERNKLVDLLHQRGALVVDMGHTHYNELGNDGRTIFAASRSIGQIEEGPPGFSLMAVDGDRVSWRFKPLAAPWPLTLITSPVDRRLATRRTESALEPGAPLTVRALAFPADEVRGCRFQIEGEAWRPMRRSSARLWVGEATTPDAPFRLTVEAQDHRGASDAETIEVDPRATAPRSDRQGSDAHAIGAWPEKHIPGGQLGPNRNGRKW